MIREYILVERVILDDKHCHERRPALQERYYCWFCMYGCIPLRVQKDAPDKPQRCAWCKRTRAALIPPDRMENNDANP